MSENPIFDYISSAAVSLTMAGNTGISPFLTLFLLGFIEAANPELLNMGETMEFILASWWSIGILALLTVAELVGKCIPAIDELIDSAETFVIPAISILATMATMGMFPMPKGYQSDAGQGQTIDVIGIFGGDGDGVGEGFRNLQEEFDEDVNSNAFSEGFMTFTKIGLVTVGIGLSLAIHFFKMLVRVSSLACTGGCCQPCITIVEYLVVVFGVVLAILAPAFAIITCIALLVAAGYIIRAKCFKKEENDSDKSSGNEEKKSTEDKRIDVALASAEWVDNPKPPAEAFGATDLEDVPLPPKNPSAPPSVEAKTY